MSTFFVYINLDAIKSFRLGLLTLFLFMSSQLFSQENQKFIFLDAMYGNPVSDVEVFDKSKFITKTDKNGQCFVPKNTKTIYCLHTGYSDTLVNLAYHIGDEIMLNPRYKILDEVEIKGNYKAKKHFKRLIEQSRETVQDLDTTFYYLIHDKIVHTDDTIKAMEMFLLQKTTYSNKTKQVHYIMEKLISYNESLDYSGTQNIIYIGSTSTNKKKLLFSMPDILYSVKRGESFGGDTIQFLVKIRDLFWRGTYAFYFVSNKLRAVESAREMTLMGINYQLNSKLIYSCSPYVVLESSFYQAYVKPKSELVKKFENLHKRIHRCRKDRVPKPKRDCCGVDASSVYSSYDAIRLGRKAFLGKDTKEEFLPVKEEDLIDFVNLLDSLDADDEFIDIKTDMEKLLEEHGQ